MMIMTITAQVMTFMAMLLDMMMTGLTVHLKETLKITGILTKESTAVNGVLRHSR